MFSDPRTKTLLQKMLENGTFKLTPNVDLKGISYPLVDQALPNVPENEVRYLLKSLSKSGILEPKFLDKFVTCPSCGSPSVISRYNCVRCKSIDVSRLSIIEHTSCGFTESRSRFEIGPKLVCPSCKRPLSDNDYKEIGMIFECNSCGSRFQAPNTSHKCTMCKVTFTHKEAGYEPVLEYELSEDAKREISSAEPFLASLEEVFVSRGFNIAHQSTVLGKSGANHKFDIVARSSDALIVANLSFRVREEDIIGFFAKKYDVDPSLAMLISLTPPSQEQVMTSGIYGVQIVYSTASRTVTEQIAEILDYNSSRADTSDQQSEKYEEQAPFM